MLGTVVVQFEVLRGMGCPGFVWRDRDNPKKNRRAAASYAGKGDLYPGMADFNGELSL